MGREVELHKQVLDRAQSDPAFRDQLKRDPSAAIKDATGVDIPSELRITVVEDTPSNIHIVLPPTASGTLSDAELSRVAADNTGSTACGISSSTCAPWTGSLWGHC